MSLEQALKEAPRRQAIVADCVRILEEEIAAKRGLGGRALRAGYAAFQSVRPGISHAAFDRLLPRFAPVIDPHWDRACSGGDPRAYFRSHEGEIADGLLAVTDQLAERATNRGLSRLYRSLRGRARPHVISGVQRIPELIEAHLPR
ncbi:MAG TPA: hypothetical protein ENK18_08900 [Deltaproteobacteria bacterium]|nr:hypothetical protein [Deltaproteobacteria bacterium]